MPTGVGVNLLSCLPDFVVFPILQLIVNPTLVIGFPENIARRSPKETPQCTLRPTDRCAPAERLTRSQSAPYPYRFGMTTPELSFHIYRGLSFAFIDLALFLLYLSLSWTRNR
jgi:hypothetical protein